MFFYYAHMPFFCLTLKELMLKMLKNIQIYAIFVCFQLTVYTMKAEDNECVE